MNVDALNTEWRRWLVEPVIPEGEGPGKPLSLRVPEQLLKRIDVVAKETRNSRTDAVLHLLRWALSKYESEREAERARRGDAA